MAAEAGTRSPSAELRGVARSVADLHGLLLLLTLLYYLVGREQIGTAGAWLPVLAGYGVLALVTRAIPALVARPRARLFTDAVLMVLFLTALLALAPGGAGPVEHLFLLPVLLVAFVLGRGPTLALLGLVVAGRIAVGLGTHGAAWLSLPSAVALFIELSPTLLGAIITSALAADLHLVTGRLRVLEERDPLTGLWNLTTFSTRLAAAGRRLAPGDSYALLMVDIDDLRQINDRFGLEAGDRALRAVAEALTRATRDTDTCARFGSDEFVVYLPGGTRESAEVIANRIRHHVFSATQDFDYAMRRLAVSIGIAIHGTDGDDPRVLMQVAARALQADRAERRLRSQRYSTVPGKPA